VARVLAAVSRDRRVDLSAPRAHRSGDRRRLHGGRASQKNRTWRALSPCPRSRRTTLPAQSPQTEPFNRDEELLFISNTCIYTCIYISVYYILLLDIISITYMNYYYIMIMIIAVLFIIITTQTVRQNRLSASETMKWRNHRNRTLM
jgi:hypothetical protein